MAFRGNLHESRRRPRPSATISLRRMNNVLLFGYPSGLTETLNSVLYTPDPSTVTPSNAPKLQTLNSEVYKPYTPTPSMSIFGQRGAEAQSSGFGPKRCTRGVPLRQCLGFRVLGLRCRCSVREELMACGLSWGCEASDLGLRVRVLIWVAASGGPSGLRFQELCRTCRSFATVCLKKKPNPLPPKKNKIKVCIPIMPL